jgi:hypothetical protein
VVRTLLTDRSEQQPGEATVSARADDEQVGVARLVDEDGGRRSFADLPLDGDAVGVGHNLVHDRVERDLGAAAQLAEIGAGDGREALDALDPDVAELPGMDDAQGCLSQLRLVEREPEGGLRSLRAVDADDDQAVPLLDWLYRCLSAPTGAVVAGIGAYTYLRASLGSGSVPAWANRSEASTTR